MPFASPSKITRPNAAPPTLFFFFTHSALTQVILNLKYISNSMLHKTNDIVIPPRVLYIEVHQKNPSQMQSLTTFTKYSKQTNTQAAPFYLNNKQHVVSHYCPLTSSHSSKGITGELESIGRHQRAERISWHRLTPATTTVQSSWGTPEPSSDHWGSEEEDRRGSVPPWAESMEEKTKPHVPAQIPHLCFVRKKG